jgi:DNA-binding MarR family transcriptional regulator
VEPEATQPDPSDLDVLIDEMDSQTRMLGRLFSARHGVGGHDCDSAGPHGAGALSMPQFMLLGVVGAEGPMKMADIATLLGIKAPAVSAIVDTAEAAGHVTREADPVDRRITRVAITSAGTAALLQAESERRELMRRFVSVLSLDDLRALIRIQHTLIEALIAEKI